MKNDSGLIAECFLLALAGIAILLFIVFPLIQNTGPDQNMLIKNIDAPNGLVLTDYGMFRISSYDAIRLQKDCIVKMRVAHQIINPMGWPDQVYLNQSNTQCFQERE